MRSMPAEHVMSHGLPKSKKGKKPHSITIHKGASGGFIAEHHHPDHMGESPKHAIPSMAALKKHLQEHMGEEVKEMDGGGEQEALG